MDFITEQVFFIIFCNSSPTCRGRRILAIYYVKITGLFYDFFQTIDIGNRSDYSESIQPVQCRLYGQKIYK